MRDESCAFHGFCSDAAKKSFRINAILKHLIAGVSGVKSEIDLVTSTPKPNSRMEISFSKHGFHVNMDHDSGYMSLHQESNSDSSLENINQTLPNPTASMPVYLSEDALLETPEVYSKNVIETNDEDKSRTDCSSGNTSTSPYTILSTSIKSQRTTYSGFDNSDSDISIEVPCADQIVVEHIDRYFVDNDVNCSRNSYSNNYNANLRAQKAIISDEYVMLSQFEEVENCSALYNITNTCSANNEKKKKLTLIFSKKDKENSYSVRRKFQSTSPVKSPTECTVEVSDNVKGPNLDHILFKQNDVEQFANSFSQELPSFDINNGIVNSLEKNQCLIGEIKNEIDDENPEKELILKKDLDLDELILKQDIEDEKMSSSKQNSPHIRGLDQFDDIQQNLPPTLTPIKKFENPIDPNMSPDLFESDEIPQEVIKEIQPLDFIAQEQYIVKKDQRILRRAQNSLKGVLPPYSVTVVQLTFAEMLNRIEANQDYFWTEKQMDTNNEKLNVSDESVAVGESKSLLVMGNEECVKAEWPQILNERYHGLHHNRSKLSEEFEDLCTKYSQRYVGAETQSTFTVFDTNCVSPTKRKQVKQRWAVKSPGRRLSHLAKRRITFSSANLQGGASSSFANSRARQILVDAKKLELLNRRKSPRKSPRKNLRRTPRKTPSKSPRLKTRTPSSSAKKKLAMRFRELTGEIENTVPCTSSSIASILPKRALFKSPDREKQLNFFQPSTSGLSAFENELKKPTTKRALFISPSKRSPLKKSPFKRSPFKRLDLGDEKKRKRLDCDDVPPPKLARSMPMDIRPSQSEVGMKFCRMKNDINIMLNKSQATGELSAVHKKKLQWAVYEALRSQNITPTHPQFKIFASILARVTRRFILNLTNSTASKDCGTTEKMLRIARHHVYAVVKGKTVEEIIDDYLRNRAKNVKPQGYVGPENCNVEKKCLETTTRESVTQSRVNLDKRKLELLGKPKGESESRIDRIRKVINFGEG